MRRPALRRAGPLLALLLLLLAPAARAQLEIDTDLPVSLIADEVAYDAETGRVTAAGNVEVYYGDRTLTADRIVYDDRTGRIRAEGDLVLRDPGGATVFADVADLDVELREGLVRGAQSVISGDVKLAAVEARRVGDRYNALAKAVYSPCRVCQADPTPLWAIRARRVIHDEIENVIHYENATFLVLGVPVAWMPYFRHPDPTVDRATGFLVPSFLSSSIFGHALKVPFYWVIDPYSDLMVTPFVTTDDGPLLELEYRRRFRAGDVEFGGSVTWNDYEEGEGRLHGFVDTEGLFDVGAGIDAGWDITVASDDAFLRRFEYEYGDRLTSELFVRRYRRESFFDITGLRFQSLRANEPAGQIPMALPVLEARWETPEPLLDGELGFFTSAYVLERPNGRDAKRFSLGADWERQEILPVGLGVTGFAQIRGDLFSVDDDPAIDGSPTSRLTGHAGVELRYPLIRHAGGGTSHIIEPVVQAIAAPYGHNDPDIPVEDSLVTEFDELNVIDRNHFSGVDAFEAGPRLNVLMRYDRITDDGLRFDAAAGRVFRLDSVPAFSPGSGLRGTESDWVASWQAIWDPHVVLRHRMRLEDDFAVNHNEFFGMLDFAPVQLSATYAFFQADPQVGAPTDREEVSASAGLRIDRNWSISGLVQRDLEQDEFIVLGGQLTYQNECTAIDLFLRRRFTDLEDAPASTSFGVNVRLLTLGAADFEPRGRGTGLLGDRLLGLGGGGCG